MNETNPNATQNHTDGTTTTETQPSTQTITPDSEKITGEHEAVNTRNPGSGVFANLKRLFFTKRVNG